MNWLTQIFSGPEPAVLDFLQPDELPGDAAVRLFRYNQRREAAIQILGTKWPLHPANRLDFRRAGERG